MNQPRTIKESVFKKYEGQWVVLVDGIEEPVVGRKNINQVIETAEKQYPKDKITYMPVYKFGVYYVFQYLPAISSCK